MLFSGLKAFVASKREPGSSRVMTILKWPFKSGYLEVEVELVGQSKDFVENLDREEGEQKQ